MKSLRTCLSLAVCLLLALAPLAGNALALTVYYNQNVRLYREALAHYQGADLDLPRFLDAAALEQAWITAYLSGDAPDVVLLDINNTLPIWRLAQEEAFLDLAPLLLEDPYYNPSDYLTPLLSAGELDGGQYFMPFAFALTHVFTTRERLEDYDIALDVQEISLEAFVDMLWRHFEELIGHADAAALTWSMRRADGPMQVMEHAGLPVVDYVTREVIVDKNALFEIGTMIRTHFEYASQLQGITSRYRNNFVGAAERITFMMEDLPWLNNLRYYDTAYGSGLWQEMVCFVLPDWADAGRYHAQITQYAGVSAGASDPYAAYDLLRYIQDYDVTDTSYSKYQASTVLDLPLSRAALETHMDKLMLQQGSYLMLGTGRTAIEPLPEFYAEQIWATLEGIEDAFLPDRAVGAILMECLTPYYLMEDDFDMCFEELTERLLEYMNEAPFETR